MPRRLGPAPLGLALAACLLAAQPAEGAPKLPKTLCFEITSPGSLMVLALKKTGRATTAAGKRVFYAIAGEWSYPLYATSAPLAGSGHLAGDVLHFSVTASDLRESDSHYSAVHFQGKWDLVQHTGVISNLFLWESGGPQASSGDAATLLEIGCEQVPIYY